MRQFLFSLPFLLASCSATISSYEKVVSKTHCDAPWALHQQIEIREGGRTTQFEAALECDRRGPTLVLLTPLGIRGLLLNEREGVLFIERSRLLSLPVTERTLWRATVSFLNKLSHSGVPTPFSYEGNGALITLYSAE